MNAGDTPVWVIAAALAVFLIAGLMIRFGKHSRINDALAGVILFLFGAIGTWVAVFSSADGLSGGLPFLPRDWNISLGRWFFGVGALVCFALSVYALRRALSANRNG